MMILLELLNYVKPKQNYKCVNVMNSAYMVEELV
jgi:hypothetical protein